MATDLVKSAGITGLDARPFTPVVVGKAAGGHLKHVDDMVTAIALSDTNSIYRILRVPSNAKIKSLKLWAEANGASTAWNIGLYYSTNPNDGTPLDLLGTVIDADFFATAVANTNAIQASELIATDSPGYTINEHDKPLWEAAGLTADPGGYFDICMAPSTAVGTGTGRIRLACQYVV
jgi:hypothetical protein